MANEVAEQDDERFDRMNYILFANVTSRCECVKN